MTDCLICQLPLKHEPDVGIFDCERCGHFEIISTGTTTSLRELLADPGPSKRRRANLSHKVRRRTRRGERHVGVPLAELDRWGLDEPLPTPSEMLDVLILWVGDNAPAYNEQVPVEKRPLAAWLGLPISHPDRPDHSMDWLLNEPAAVRHVVIPNRAAAQLALKLTWDGWQRYDDLKRQEATSYTAFMAMKFGDAELDAVVEDHFKPAVAATGFTLKRLNDGQGAGLIDDQMRVALRTCRYVIADLTHSNLGAYWEAGFGEGLGKPVIYTCRKDVFLAKGTHFDTSHLVTVLWDPGDIAKAVSDLKATIRNTLPDVAKMTDD